MQNMAAVILAGGIGCRLWPSPKKLPKRFLPLFGDQTFFSGNFCPYIELQQKEYYSLK